MSIVLVCPACGLKLKPRKNGVPAAETSSENPNNVLRLFHMDILGCPRCGLEVAVTDGVSTEYWHETFPRSMETALRDPDIIFYV